MGYTRKNGLIMTNGVRYSILSLCIACGFGLIVHYLTPLLATGLYELYHLTKVEFIYSCYAVIKYATAIFMLWDTRWIVSLLTGILTALIVYRHMALSYGQKNLSLTGRTANDQ